MTTTPTSEADGLKLSAVDPELDDLIGDLERTGNGLGAELRAAILVRLAAARQEMAELREALRTARDDALEEAAAWHDAQVQEGRCGEENAERYARHRANRHHQLSAEAFRAARALSGDRT